MIEAVILSVERPGDTLNVSFSVRVDGGEAIELTTGFRPNDGMNAQEIADGVRAQVVALARRATEVRNAETAAKALVGVKFQVSNGAMGAPRVP